MGRQRRPVGPRVEQHDHGVAELHFDVPDQVQPNATGGASATLGSTDQPDGNDPTSITVDENVSSVLVERPECQGDAIGGNPHQVTLTFNGPVDATAIDVQLVETPG